MLKCIRSCVDRMVEAAYTYLSDWCIRLVLATWLGAWNWTEKRNGVEL